MARSPRHTRPGRSDRDRNGDNGDDRRHHEYGYGRGHEHEAEPYDDPNEHLDIERQRFDGGLKPTPELYALAREQWYRLPGALVQPSMDTNAADTTGGDTDAGDREPER